MAGNKELIDEIVDPIAVKQVSDLDLKIKQLEATFISASKQALAFNAAAGGSTTNSSFVKNVNESNKSVKALIDTREKLTKTIISNSDAEVDAYNKAKSGQEGITGTVNKRNQAEGKAANEATARSAKALAQQQAQATEYVRASGLIEKLQIKLKGYRLAQSETTDPRALNIYNQKIQSTEKLIGQLSNVGKEGFDSLGNSVKRSGNVFTSAAQKLVTLARILPGIGVVGLIAFAVDPIIDYISALDLFGKKITESQRLVAELNEVNKSAATEYGTQSVKLKILYETATNLNNSYAIRLSATRELKQEFPGTFENLTNEEIMTGKVDAQVKALTGSLLEQAIARASLNKIQELAGKQQEILFQKEKIRIANENENLQTTATMRKRLRGATEFDNKNFGRGLSASQIDKAVDAELPRFLAENNKSTTKELLEQDKIFTRYQQQIDFFMKNIKPVDVESVLGGGDGGKADADAAKKRADEAKKRAEELLKIARDSAIELRELQNDYEKQIEDARKRGEKAEADRLKKELKDKEDALSDSNNKRLLLNSQYEDEALNLLTSRYQQGLITLKEYEDGRQIIEQQSGLESIDSAIQLSKDLIAIQKKAGENTQTEEDKLAKLRLSRSKLVRDGIIADLKTEADARKSLKDLTKQVAEEAAQFVITLVDAGFENRKNKIQEEINLVDENSKAEIDAVNRSLLSTSEKADKVKLIEAQADAQKKQLQREQKRTDIEKAKFDKAIALARIVQATAEAEISALSYLSNPITAPLYPGIAALIGALGAIQLATVLATPIPAYEKGTKNAQGGMSLVGEKGTEYVITPNGATFLTPNKATLMDIPKGSTVVPHLETVKMVDVKKYSGGQAIDMSEVVRAIERKKFTNGKTIVSGWRSEVRADNANSQRHKDYFN